MTSLSRQVTASAPSRGFTLLEMLVTLAVVALTVSILAEALFQLNRLEALLSGGRLQAQTDMVRTQWVRQALAGLQPGDASGRGRFQGSTRVLEGWTGNPLVTGGAAYGPLRLSLRYDASVGETILWSEDPKVNGAAAPVALLRWTGDVGRWHYMDKEGNTHEQWPPSNGERRKLPSVVALMAQPDGLPLVIVDVLADNDPRPSRLEYEAM